MKEILGAVTMTLGELSNIPEIVAMCGGRMVRDYPCLRGGKEMYGLREVYVTFCEGADNRRKALFTRYMKSLGVYMHYREKKPTTTTGRIQEIRMCTTFGAARVLKRIPA